jgi:hypothetical protein
VYAVDAVTCWYTGRGPGYLCHSFLLDQFQAMSYALAVFGVALGPISLRVSRMERR